MFMESQKNLFTAVREKQDSFEKALVGTDGSLYDINGAEYALERGIIGEAYEALEALTAYGMHSEEFRSEVVDIFNFFCSLLNHIEMSEQELAYWAGRILLKNHIKYHPRNFEGRTVMEGLEHSREIWGGNGYHAKSITDENKPVTHSQSTEIVVYQSPVTDIVLHNGG